MSASVMFHIVAGGLALLAGFIALGARKGGAAHARAGRAFTLTMIAMTTSGALLAVLTPAAPSINLPAALVTAYLVVTGVTTMRAPARGARPMALATLSVAFAVGAMSLGFGFEALATGRGRDGMAAFPFFLFGLLGLAGGVGDVRLLRAGGVAGTARLRRHLWRMTSALLIAAMSFFLGQADEIPKALRIPGLLALPVLTPLVVMLAWLWRLRGRRAAGSMPVRTPRAGEAG